jgi:hypothetical protein
MTSVADLFGHILAIDEGKAEFAQNVIKIINNLALTEDEKLTKINKMAEKAIERYERMSQA